MTSSNPEKAYGQLKVKPAKLKKFKKHNYPKKREFGQITKRCVRCGRMGAHISKYNLNLCRQCFREIAKKIGFKKYS